MNRKFKSTEEVAQSLGWDTEPCYGPVIGEEVIRSVHAATLNILESPEDTVEDVALYFMQAIAPTLAFNIIGNGRVDYSTKYKQTQAQSKKSFAILAEEVKELRVAMQEKNKVEILDAVADIIVVAIGIALKEGVIAALPKAFAMVSHNNLLKFHFDESTQGFYPEVKNGKIQKPEGFVGVDLSVLDTAGSDDAETKHVAEGGNLHA